MNKVMRFFLCLLFFLTLSFWIFQLAQASTAASAAAWVRYPQQTLILDAGHGGEDGGAGLPADLQQLMEDGGAVSLSGVPESGINLSIVLKVDQLAGLYGVRTKLTRDTDTSIADSSAKTLREKKRSDLYNRAALVNETPGAVLLSVHQNNHSTKSASGAQVFFHDDSESVLWAQRTQQLLRETLGTDPKREATRIAKKVYLMNHINCRAILVECGFLSNPREDQLLQQEDYQTKLAMVLMSAYLTG